MAIQAIFKIQGYLSPEIDSWNLEKKATLFGVLADCFQQPPPVSPRKHSVCLIEGYLFDATSHWNSVQKKIQRRVLDGCFLPPAIFLKWGKFDRNESSSGRSMSRCTLAHRIP